MEIQSCQEKPLNTCSPPSTTSSSPAHEFSFAISLHQSPPATTTHNPPVDLSPADEIFFHGHLLPLHLLSHLPISPRSSTNSFLQDQINPHHENTTNEAQGRVKSNSFSIFSLSKWRKGCEIKEKEKDQEKHKKKLLKFDVNNVLKRYMKMVRPLLALRGSRNSRQFHRQTYSFSAPASTRTSPTNSGLLVATGGLASSTSDDSTMEELQAAIQAAITHCKNSIAMPMEEKIN